MVTTKRQIRKDSDRFGGYYGTESNGSTLISDYDLDGLEPITAPERPSSMIMTDIDTDITTPEPIAAPKVLYTTLDTAARTAEIPSEPIALPKREKREVIREKEDLLPTVKTRAYASEKPVRAEEDEQEKTVSASRRSKVMSSKTKLLLVAYVAVALALAIAVIATGVSISSASAAADVYSASIARNQVVISEQQAQLADMRDDEVIRSKAEDLGMVEAGAPAYSVGPVESVGYPAATPRTDWFDKFCDWFGKVFA